MNILITGGSGFIGRNLRETLEKEHTVSTPSHKDVDFTDMGAVRALMHSGAFEAVVHTAEQPLFGGDAAAITLHNVRMFTVLTKCAADAGVKKFIHFGSGTEYGDNTDSAGEEQFGKRIPDAPLGYQKYLIHRLMPQGMETVNLRCFGVFGKYEDYSNRFISNAICRAMYGYPITIRQDRPYSYIYIDDLCALTAQILVSGTRHRVYNVCSDEQWSLMDIARLIRRIACTDVSIDIAKETPGAPYTGSNTRLRRELRYTFTPLFDAVQMLFDWYVLNADMIDKEKILYHR